MCNEVQKEKSRVHRILWIKTFFYHKVHSLVIALFRVDKTPTHPITLYRNYRQIMEYYSMGLNKLGY